MRILRRAAPTQARYQALMAKIKRSASFDQDDVISGAQQPQHSRRFILPFVSTGQHAHDADGLMRSALLWSSPDTFSHY